MALVHRSLYSRLSPSQETNKTIIRKAHEPTRLQQQCHIPTKRMDDDSSSQNSSSYLSEDLDEPEQQQQQQQQHHNYEMISRLAVFGDSSFSLVASFVLLMVAISLALKPDNSISPVVIPASKQPNIWQPGDLNQMFERIVATSTTDAYKVGILSKPSEGPWVLVLDEFLSQMECQRLIQLGHQKGYKPSGDVVANTNSDDDKDGTKTYYQVQYNTRRTSTNAWCDADGHCDKDPIVQNIQKRIQQLTNIPKTHSEHFQLIRYETNQHYETHSDFIPYSNNPRIATLLLYLNDVMDGGETRFPALNLSVSPKCGRAVLWPNVYDHKPKKKDPRTNHQALPVTKEGSTKYAANVWLHQQEYQQPNYKAEE